MSFSSKSVRTYSWFSYVFFSGLVTALVIALAVLNVWQEQKQQREEALVGAQSVANLVANHVSEVFSRGEAVLKAVDYRYRELIRRGSVDPEEFTDYLRVALTWIPPYSNIGFINAQGVYQFGADVFQPISLADREYFSMLRDLPDNSGGDPTFFSAPVFTKLSNQWVLVLARRVESPDGSFRGVLFLRWNIDQTQTVLQGLGLPAGDTVALLTQSLELVTRYPSSKAIVSATGTRNVSETFANALSDSPIDGAFELASPLDTVVRQYYYSKVDRYPFYVLAGRPLPVGLTAIPGAVVTLILSSLMILLTIVGAWWMHRQAQIQLQNQRDNIANRVLAASPVAMFLLDRNNTIVNVNPAAHRLFGISNVSFIGQSADRLHANQTSPATPAQLFESTNGDGLINEELFTRQDGSIFTALKSISVVEAENGEPEYFIETVVDITTIKLTQEKLRQQANTDELTGLLNRRAAEYVLNQPVREALSTDSTFSVIMCDVDLFKRVNDRFGHQAGDVVLKNVATTMKTAVRVGDYCIRWGGEEFLIILPGCVAEVAGVLANRIREEIAKLEHGPVGVVTMSFGVAQWDKSESVETLILRADKALYKAKRSGRNQVCLWTAEPNERSEGAS